ncbi:hypothetical protein LOTGIDRAFT_236765 [Lottia gigantea]|uniref:Meiotic recombination protein REC114 n=1 Tax=Lottia gigantea TaxID=225164 RepID=V3ZL80_LOTGI|nr:hypothetical protein LOTGIDRAFT_236765 [Lottia gigantea]ESO83165.1 hypothetical protein LOTGIDRAFT_236765 [Lottia gigantea]
MSFIWKLEKYARHDVSRNEGKGGWEVYESSKAELNMTLTESSFLVICHGPTVVESHSLVTARASIRGLVKGDSMMIMYKIRGNTRKFRISFKPTEAQSGIQVCQGCTDKLNKFFPVKITIEPTSESQEATQDPNKMETNETEPQVQTLEGEVSMSTMAQVLTGQLKANLPKAYKETNLPTQDIGMFLRMCLSDPSFPDFVENVDQELKKITKETESDL